MPITDQTPFAPRQPEQSNFTVRQPLFPDNRPDVQPTPQEPMREPTPQNKYLLMSKTQQVDMEVVGMVMGKRPIFDINLPKF